MGNPNCKIGTDTEKKRWNNIPNIKIQDYNNKWSLPYSFSQINLKWFHLVQKFLFNLTFVCVSLFVLATWTFF